MRDRNLFKKKIILLVFILGYSLNIATVFSFWSDKDIVSKERFAYEEKVVEAIREDENIHIGIIYPEDHVGFGNCSTPDRNFLATFLDVNYNDIVYYSVIIGTKGISFEISTFLELYRKAKNDNPSLTQDDFRLDFIEKTNINYILVYKGGKVSENLKDKIQLVAEDTESEEYFYKVN
jgi:hypothetical protein